MKKLAIIIISSVLLFLFTTIHLDNSTYQKSIGGCLKEWGFPYSSIQDSLDNPSYTITSDDNFKYTILVLDFIIHLIFVIVVYQLISRQYNKLKKEKFYSPKNIIVIVGLISFVYLSIFLYFSFRCECPRPPTIFEMKEILFFSLLLN